MFLVVADTGPINYLVLIGHIDILPALFQRVFVPSAVQRELTSERTPLMVKTWIQKGPSWLDVRDPDQEDETLLTLDPGERAALDLALSINADMVLRNRGPEPRLALDDADHFRHHAEVSVAPLRTRLRTTPPR